MTKLQVLKEFLAYVLDNKDQHKWCKLSNCHCGLLLKSCNLYEEQVSIKQPNKQQVTVSI